MYRKFEFDVTENLFFCIVYFSSELNTVKMQVLGVLISSTVSTVLAGAGHVVKAVVGWSSPKIQTRPLFSYSNSSLNFTMKKKIFCHIKMSVNALSTKY
jgi:hypothetical protein